MEKKLDKESIIKNARPMAELAMRLKIFHLDKKDRELKMKKYIDFMGIKHNGGGFIKFPVYKYDGFYYCYSNQI